MRRNLTFSDRWRRRHPKRIPGVSKHRHPFLLSDGESIVLVSATKHKGR